LVLLMCGMSWASRPPVRPQLTQRVVVGWLFEFRTKPGRVVSPSRSSVAGAEEARWPEAEVGWGVEVSLGLLVLVACFRTLWRHSSWSQTRCVASPLEELQMRISSSISALLTEVAYEEALDIENSRVTKGFP
jgi:hypothetical protein